MTTFKRYIGGLPAAAAVTLGLGVIMAGLIRHDGPPPTEGERIVMAEINAIPDDIIPDRNRDLPILRVVETPPPPPIIDVQTPRLPSEPIAEPPGDIGDLPKPKITLTGLDLRVTETYAKPLFRVAPVMPLRATRSGHCDMRFDVSADGAPYNVTALSCSQSLFERSAIAAVQKWTYSPKVSGGQRVARRAIKTRITYTLKDERGNVIPE